MVVVVDSSCKDSADTREEKDSKGFAQVLKD